MATIVLRNLSKTFGTVKAVDRLNLEIAEGEFVTLLGPSGCGKSTTLYCIAGLEAPTSGEILFDDQVVNDLSPRDRDVAMVFQDYALYPHMSVYDNLAFALRLRRGDKSTISNQVGEVAQMLGLGELLNRRPSQLSGGQRQRVALGRAIIRDPVAYLMDEPLSNLDAALRVRTRTEIKKLQRDLGVTTVFVTHDQEEAMVLSDHIAIMRAGVLQQYGTPREVYYNPANQYVAGFMGSPAMNFMSGRIDLDQGDVVFAFGENAARFAPSTLREPPSGLSTTRATTLGVRPEDIEVLPQPSSSDLPAEVFLVEPVGATTYVDLALGGLTLKASISPDLPLSAGDKVGVRMRKDRAYFFESQSGARL